jgi:hypothetical protein
MKKYITRFFIRITIIQAEDRLMERRNKAVLAPPGFIIGYFNISRLLLPDPIQDKKSDGILFFQKFVWLSGICSKSNVDGAGKIRLINDLRRQCNDQRAIAGKNVFSRYVPYDSPSINQICLKGLIKRFFGETEIFLGIVETIEFIEYFFDQLHI